jgi:hypothetical protein
MSIILVNASPERNIFLSTGDSTYWLYFNDSGRRWKCRAKAKFESSRAVLDAAAEVAEVIESGEVPWSDFWPEEDHGVETERRDSAVPRSASRRF